MKYLHLIIYIIAIAISSLFASCANDESTHADEDARLSSSVVFALSWYDPADAGTPVTFFAVDIYDANGNVVFSHKKLTTKDIASSPVDLKQGSYSASICDGTFYCVVGFEIKATGLLIVNAPLQRITAQLTVIVEGAPSGATLNGRVLNASKGWQFALGSDNKIALQLSSVPAEVELPSASAVDGVITTTPLLLMPTVPGDSKSLVEVEITESDGTRRGSLLTCDRMNPAGKYIIKLNYSDISTPLTLSTVTINQWETMFVYEGEVLNPIN